jgi:hypothetical protein
LESLTYSRVRLESLTYFSVRLESLTYSRVRLESLTYFSVRLESLTYAAGENPMDSTNGKCTWEGGLALASAAVVPVTGSWLAATFC